MIYFLSALKKIWGEENMLAAQMIKEEKIQDNQSTINTKQKDILQNIYFDQLYLNIKLAEQSHPQHFEDTI